MEQSSFDPVETIDSLLGGELEIAQRLSGQRFNVDSLLLADIVPLDEGRSLLDLGCGNGVLSMILAHSQPAWRVVGLEIQSPLVELARRNIERNGLGDRVEIISGDVRDVGELVGGERFDTVVCNPPYYPTSAGRTNPDPELAVSRHEICGDLAVFVRAAYSSLAPRGRLFTVYPADRLEELLVEIPRAGLVPHWLRFIHHDRGRSATSVIALSRRIGAPRVEIKPPLFVTEETCTAQGSPRSSEGDTGE